MSGKGFQVDSAVTFEGARSSAEPESELTLRFDRFGRRELSAVAKRQGRSLDALLVDALAHLDAGLQRRRCAAAPPSFASRRIPGTLEMRVRAPSWRLERLRAEASRRQLPLEGMVEHALLLYLADLELGRSEGG